MEVDDGDEQIKFLERLKSYNGYTILGHINNLLIFPSYLRLHHERKKFDEELLREDSKGKAESDLKGIDLDEVKHFNYDQLIDANQIETKYVLGKSLFGRFVAGQDLSIKNSTIKTWDLVYPQKGYLFHHPARLHNEIMLLMKELKSHPNLPKLTGYSIDKRLAVVYDFKAKRTLKCALQSGDLGWDARMKFAIQVASLLEHFHQSNIIIGSIDSANILIDENDDLKLCEFGVVARMPKMFALDNCLNHYGGGSYSCQALECHEGGKWTIKTDIFAFGCLLLELVTKEEAVDHPLTLHSWALKMLESGKRSIIHKYLLEDEDIGAEITQLIMSCLEVKPEHRPNLQYITDALKKLAMGNEPIGGRSNKRKFDSC